MPISFVSRNAVRVVCDHCKKEIAISHLEYIDDCLHQVGAVMKIKKYHPVDIRKFYFCEDCAELSDDVLFNTEE
jgi:hypothetical protein